jgi:CheY-like chemotaxis protein
VIHRPDNPRKIDALPCDRRQTAGGAYLGRLLGPLDGIVDIVGSLSDDRPALGNFKYDLAILNRMLPEGDDLDIVMALSQLPERPAFIMPTAKDAEEDVIDGLNSGADDISWLEASGSRRTGDCECNYDNYTTSAFRLTQLVRLDGTPASKHGGRLFVFSCGATAARCEFAVTEKRANFR